MKSTYIWQGKKQGKISDERGNEVIVDLPKIYGGDNEGTTPLDLCMMSFSGCIGVIFGRIAKKMQLEYSALEIEMEAIKEDSEPTVSSINYLFKIKSEDTDDKIDKCLRLTESTCPVGVIFTKAGIEISYTIIRD